MLRSFLKQIKNTFVKCCFTTAGYLCHLITLKITPGISKWAKSHIKKEKTKPLPWIHMTKSKLCLNYYPLLTLCLQSVNSLWVLASLWSVCWASILISDCHYVCMFVSIIGDCSVFYERHRKHDIGKKGGTLYRTI